MKKHGFLNHVSIKYRLLLTTAVIFLLSAFLILFAGIKLSEMFINQKIVDYSRDAQYSCGVSINNLIRTLNREATAALDNPVLDREFNGRTESFAITGTSALSMLSSKAIGGVVIISNGGVKGYYGFMPGSVESPPESTSQRIGNADIYFDSEKIYTDTSGEKYLVFVKRGGTPSHPYTLAIYIKASSLYDIAFMGGVNSDCRLCTADGTILVAEDYSEIGRTLSSVTAGDKGSDIITSNIILDHALSGVTVSERINYQSFNGSARLNIATAMIAAALVAAALLALSILLSARVITPLKKVTEGLSAYNGEEIDDMYIGTGGNEIDELTDTYDNMLHRINKLVAQTKSDAEKQRALELTALQEQINPHFLYNTLDNIAWMARIKDQPDIETLVVSLARFFRISLHKGDKYIYVSEEIDLVKNFVNIQQKRFPEKIEIIYNISKSVAEQKMLKILLQPFVENSLKHGFRDSGSSGRITINGFHGGDGRDIIFEIIDNGVGFDVPENFINLERVHRDQLSGYGINNVEERIKLEYGQAYGVSIISRPGEGTKVTLRIRDLPENKEI